MCDAFSSLYIFLLKLESIYKRDFLIFFFIFLKHLRRSLRSNNNFSCILLQNFILSILSILLCVNFKLTNKEIFCSFVLKHKYIFNRYIVASLLQQILNNNILQFI